MSGQQNFQQRAPRAKNPLDLKHLKLVCKNEDGKQAALTCNLFANNPRFTVYTNVEADKDKDYGKISANFNILSYRSAMILLEEAINFEPGNGKEEFKEKIDLFGTAWYQGKPSQQPVLQAHFWVGKDKAGCVWIAVQAPDEKNRPRLKFVIVPDDWTSFTHGTGESYSKGEASVVWAKSYYRTMEDLVPHMQVSHYQEPPPPKDNGGNRGGQGGGGYQGNNGGGGNRPQGSGGGSRQMSDDSDDIPF